VHVWSVSSWREALRAVRHLVADREERGEWVPLTWEREPLQTLDQRLSTRGANRREPAPRGSRSA
jgi:hypothetical protein